VKREGGVRLRGRTWWKKTEGRGWRCGCRGSATFSSPVTITAGEVWREVVTRGAPRRPLGVLWEGEGKWCEGWSGVRGPLYRRRKGRGGRQTVASANPARGTAAASGRESRGRAGSRGVREGYEEARE
jgi:hypothetical protein